MFWVFLIVLICVAIPVGGGLSFAAWKQLLNNRPPDPFAILAARFASGDIGEDEYLRSLHVLSAGPTRELPGNYIN